MQDSQDVVSYVPIEYEGIEDERRERRKQRAALERDVARLQNELTQEVNLRNAFNRALSRPLGSFPRISGNLPTETRELLLEVALLEEEVVSLEKRVMNTLWEIDSEEPLTEEESCWHLTPSSIKAELLLSPLESPRLSTSNNSIFMKASYSPRNSTDQKRVPLIPSDSPRNSTDHRTIPLRATNSPRNSTDQRTIPLRASGSPRNSTDQRSHPMRASNSPKSSTDHRGSPIVPSQSPRNSTDQRFVPTKVSPRNSTDHRSPTSFVTKREPHQASPLMHIHPFLPTKVLVPTEGEVLSLPVRPAIDSPTGSRKGCTQPTRIKSENGKVLSQPKSKDPIVAKLLSSTENSNVHTSARPTTQDRWSVDPIPPTPHVLHQPQRHSVVPPKATRPASMQFHTGAKSHISPTLVSGKGTPPARLLTPNMEYPKPVDLRNGSIGPCEKSKEFCVDDLNGDYCKSVSTISLNDVKVSEHLRATVKDFELELEQITDSGLLSNELVKLLGTICSQMQQEQPLFTSDSGASSRASVSTSGSSSMSPIHHETKTGASIKFLQECYGENYKTKRGASLQFMQDCYSGEVADTLDPSGLLRKGHIRNTTPYQRRLKS